MQLQQQLSEIIKEHETYLHHNNPTLLCQLKQLVANQPTKLTVLLYNYESFWEEDKIAGVFDNDKDLQEVLEYLSCLEDKYGELNTQAYTLEVNNNTATV